MSNNDVKPMYGIKSVGNKQIQVSQNGDKTDIVCYQTDGENLKWLLSFSLLHEQAVIFRDALSDLLSNQEKPKSNFRGETK